MIFKLVTAINLVRFITYYFNVILLPYLHKYVFTR
jgi:hypothetical protein